MFFNVPFQLVTGCERAILRLLDTPMCENRAILGSAYEPNARVKGSFPSSFGTCLILDELL